MEYPKTDSALFENQGEKPEFFCKHLHTHANSEALRYLEKSIGPTGCLAMRPFLQMDRKDLWQINMLAEVSDVAPATRDPED